jgi:hypothetical protein
MKMKHFFSSLFVFAMAFTILAGSDLANAQVITYNDFSDVSAFTLNGSAVGSVFFDGQYVLRLTNDFRQAASAFLRNPVFLHSNGSFSTSFQFQITNSRGYWVDIDGPGADGLMFVIQSDEHKDNAIGRRGGGLGYWLEDGGIRPSVGIEFDTWYNGGWDPTLDGNHVGIDLNGNIDSVVSDNVPTLMNNGQVWYAWIDYYGVTDLLEVRLSQTGTRPVGANLVWHIDLIDSLGGSTTDVYVGFTAGTGGAASDHDIRSWIFIPTVDIDIKPGSDPNCFNNDGKGTIPVAILGSASFNATQIDVDTVKLENMEIKAVGEDSKILAHIEDVNDDGFDDLVVQIQDEGSVFPPGDSTATVTGSLTDGTLFQGSDTICIVGDTSAAPSARTGLKTTWGEIKGKQ